MSITTRATATVLASTVLAGGAATAALLGAGAAQAMPTEHDATAVITVNNNTDSTMFYDGGFARDGQWVDAPLTQINAHSSERITVDGWNDGVGATMSYHLSGNSMAPRGDVTLVASDYANNTDTAGTSWQQPLDVHSFVQTGHPHASFVFDIN
ncbi:hypothetical protein [Tomitella fengzijianii]|uniref:Uncharacterized protein n=1 Tax=Tomitella fengzijianii TaxID=2597660 RepID=A0A516WZT0_9ACTN|nr:hypothetical protein [Tomitella fengzijianii]QDQ96318.1 hypothetical protein FO059_01860 [Tomitella fengzijianii]